MASKVCRGPDGCQIGDDCEPGFVCNEEDQCEIGGECGASEIAIEAIPPNLLIMLDRSCSMAGEVPNTGGKARWTVAKEAIAQVTTGFEQEIRFGLGTYSACVGNGCSAGTIVVPIAETNAAAINDFLDQTLAEGSNDGMGSSGGMIQYLCDSGDPETTTGPSLQGQVGEASLQDAARENAILLITDGEESDSCVQGGNDGPTAAANLLGQTTSVKTFAVGFGGANLAEIDAIAAAGGTTQGYEAENPMQLETALQTIAQAVVSCTFQLQSVPPDPSLIFVFFDKQTPGIPNDPVDGWTYDPATNTVTFNGQSCDDLKGGVVADVDIVYGCNTPPVG